MLGAGARRRQDVQGLRAIAVLYVVVFHAGLPWDGGFTGVDVFFVISGFVITGVLAREQHATGRLDLWRFYSRRVKRLLPALAVMLVAVSILGVVAAPVGGVTNGTGTGIFAALFSANLYVYRLSTGYFDLDSELNPLLHTWTLGVEEQLYVGFSLLLLASWALARRRGGDGRAIVLGAVAAVTVGSFAVALAAPEKLAFYGSPARAWEVGVGALIALLAVWIRRLPARAAAALGVLGAAALALTGPLVGEGSGTPAVSVLLPVAGTCALLAAGTSAATVTTRLLSWSPLVWIGDVSYSWYLWHWPLIVFATALWPSDGSGPAAVAAAVSLLPAWLSYRYVENPIRFNPRIQGRRVLALAATCVVVPIVACGGWRAVNSYMTNHLDTLVAVHDSRRLTAGEVRGCRGAYAPLPARPACTWTV
ncbi:MAG: hypothetical protein QOI80_2839, partial [Solirubrobacteraceae bacterium]|nr:hypothetical protein [Solirubrobacteraceae bacterium]